MNPSCPWPRFVFVLCCCLFVSACTCRTPAGQNLADGDVRARLGNFTVAVSEGTAMQQPHVWYKNKDLAPAQEEVRTLSVTQSVRNFPLPECESMKVEVFTGGANCCFGYYLLTRCPGDEYAAYVQPFDGGVGEPVGAMRAYPVNDPSFMYYAPKGQSGDKQLSFIRPESPRLTRYVVFEGNAWRADKPGEFTAAYKELAAKARADKDMNPSAKAITVAYYSMMAGGKKDVLKRRFQAALPKEYRNLADTIFTDIEKAVTGFAPVQNLDIAGR
ncbi:hypothetical protein LJC26_04530 [Desulfovibrio sp. OttesenSCG-928-O18]|nr:hypothetical protein [Desulfovibrio sp. OttesenSCG-928-O18]